MSETIRFGMGWLPDYPDFRDYGIDRDEIKPELKRLGQTKSVKAMLVETGVVGQAKETLRESQSLRKWCSPIEDQGKLGSCTAHAGVGIVEYFERRAFGRYIGASRLFLYKVTRNMLHLTGDSGAHLRTTMGALVLFGVPPEEYWPYRIADFDKEPPSFCYAFAQNYQAISYYRFDPQTITKDELMIKIKTLLSAGLPSMFGFTVYSSISQADKTGKIPFPTPRERVLGGHAVDAVGYDDNIVIKNDNAAADDEGTKGALLIRNSWGTEWGDEGYGWLPYEYVMKGLAIDWWSLLKNEWIDTGIFKYGEDD